MDSSVFDHLPLSSEVSSCQGRIMESAGHAESSARLQLFCTHGQVTLAMKRSWPVTSLLWKDLLQSSCPTTPLTEKKCCCSPPCSTTDPQNSDQEQTQKVRLLSFLIKRMRERSHISLILASHICLQLFPAIVSGQWHSEFVSWPQLWSSFRLLEFSIQKHTWHGQDFHADTS